jgi:hypothetical protein
MAAEAVEHCDTPNGAFVREVEESVELGVFDTDPDALRGH